ncbi:hypothetical protein NL676_013639 [Syzygium grande]|nr:hypothetical protein NL676_013639 [Syzygium grande]
MREKSRPFAGKSSWLFTGRKHFRRLDLQPNKHIEGMQERKARLSTRKERTAYSATMLWQGKHGIKIGGHVDGYNGDSLRLGVMASWSNPTGVATAVEGVGSEWCLRKGETTSGMRVSELLEEVVVVVADFGVGLGIPIVGLGE